MGDDIPHVPNKRGGGVVLGGKIAPIFFNTMEDAGALPIEVDVSELNMGDVIDVYPYKGEVRNHETGALIANFELKTDVLLDEVRAGGRIPLIIGRGLTTRRARSAGSAAQRRVPYRQAGCRQQQRLLAGAENGRPRLRRRRHSPWRVLRTEDDLRRFSGHHRPDDPR